MFQIFECLLRYFQIWQCKKNLHKRIMCKDFNPNSYDGFKIENIEADVNQIEFN